MSNTDLAANSLTGDPESTSVVNDLEISPPLVTGDRDSLLFLLPSHVLESILIRITIADLFSCAAASRSFAAAISSISSNSTLPSDPFFLVYYEGLFDITHGYIDHSAIGDRRNILITGYRPSPSKWVPLFLPLSKYAPITTSRHYILSLSSEGNVVISTPFSPSFELLLGVLAPEEHKDFFLLALMELPGDHFVVVATRTSDKLYTLVLDSRTGDGRWVSKGSFSSRFAVLSKAAFVDGLLYCIALSPPDLLLAFDIEGGSWRDVDVEVPALACRHLFGFRNDLFLVGGVEELGAIVCIGVWELDRLGRKWKVVSFTPEDVFKVFDDFGVRYFEVVNRSGILCLNNTLDDTLLMFDLEARRWWCPPPCPLPKERRLWLGHVVEPHFSLLKSFCERISRSTPANSTED